MRKQETDDYTERSVDAAHILGHCYYPIVNHSDCANSGEGRGERSDLGRIDRENCARSKREPRAWAVVAGAELTPGAQGYEAKINSGNIVAIAGER